MKTEKFSYYNVTLKFKKKVFPTLMLWIMFKLDYVYNLEVFHL